MELRKKKLKFENMFCQMFPKVKTFAFSILKSDEDAEDVAQEVFVKLWNMPELWEDADTWRGYIFPMTRNMIFNILKHKAVEQKYLNECEDYNVSSFVDDIHNELYAKEIRLLVRLTISKMSQQRRKVFLMSRQEGLGNQEIADKMNLSVRTVERHIYLALADLKKVLYLMLFISI